MTVQFLGISSFPGAIHIRSGTRIERCVVFEYTSIGDAQHRREVIVLPQYWVGLNRVAHYLGEDDSPYCWGDD